MKFLNLLLVLFLSSFASAHCGSCGVSDDSKDDRELTCSNNKGADCEAHDESEAEPSQSEDADSKKAK